MIRILTSLLLLFSITCLGQDFVNFPKDSQFYERASNNTAVFSISGKYVEKEYTSLKLTILQNQESYFEKTINVSNKQNFKWDINLISGLYEYNFEIIGIKGEDSVSIAFAEKILCGDSYLIYGQSNAVAGCCFFYFFDNVDQDYIRNYIYDPKQEFVKVSEWQTAKLEYQSPGAIGLYLAKKINTEHQIPVQIINGAAGGQLLEQLVQRKTPNSDENETFLDNFIQRIKGSGIKKFKGFIFSQGEAESYASQKQVDAYPTNFSYLVKSLKETTEIENFYFLQTNIITEPFTRLIAARFRDTQRHLKELFPELNMYAGVGHQLSGDGLHYSLSGYESISEALYKGINHHVYGEKFAQAVTGPLIQKATNFSEKNFIQLIFDENQELQLENIVDKGSHKRYLKNYFYDANLEPFIDSAVAIRNVVYLYYSDGFSGKKLSYLPGHFSDNFSPYYNGPLIKNSNGLTALTFHNFDVSDYRTKIIAPIIETLEWQEQNIRITFNPKFVPTCGDCQIELFGSLEQDQNFEKLGTYPLAKAELKTSLSWTEENAKFYLKIRINAELLYSDYLEIGLEKCRNIPVLKSILFAPNKIKKGILTRFKQQGGSEKILSPNTGIPTNSIFKNNTFKPFLAEIGKCRDY